MSSAILKSFSWCGHSIQTLCEADPEFAQHLINQSQEQRQCLVFVLLGWEQSGPARITPRELAIKIRSQSKKRLLKQFYQTYPHGLVSILKKLGSKIMVRSRYLELIELLAEPNAAKFLWHESKIKSFMITALVGLEPAYRQPSIVRNVINKSVLHSVQYAIAVARRITPHASDTVLAKSLEETFAQLDKTSRDGYEIKWKIQNWITRRLNKTIIPAPPWNGTLNLRPITKSKDILKTARDFDNCLANFLPNIISKKRFFYLWQGKGTVIIALENEPLLGWIVGEIKGPKNKSVSERTKEKIMTEFRAAGFEEYQGARELSWYD